MILQSRGITGSNINQLQTWMWVPCNLNTTWPKLQYKNTHLQKKKL